MNEEMIIENIDETLVAESMEAIDDAIQYSGETGKKILVIVGSTIAVVVAGVVIKKMIVKKQGKLYNWFKEKKVARIERKNAKAEKKASKND